MPIEIRELVIKTNVVTGGNYSQHLPIIDSQHPSYVKFKEDIIAECIEEISDKIQSKYER